MKNFKFTINGQTYDVDIKQVEDNIASIEVNGTSYNVQLHNEVKAQAPKTPKLVTKSANLQDGESFMKKVSVGSGIKSPLPGIILEVHVKVGDAVKRGQKLMTMEAMKMHNDVLAEKDGTVKAIKANAGQSVMEGEVLVELG
ncbi:MAG: biotin/lipoyl-binding protein [Bacteroidales bacterium]|nr:biotin/lipoyl-binding protein [Bacteroidales bacterium]